MLDYHLLTHCKTTKLYLHIHINFNQYFMIKSFTLKKIIGIALILFPILAQAQSSKIFVELGGNYHRPNSNTNDDRGEIRVSNEETTKNTRITSLIGYYINDQLSIGIEYAYSKNLSSRLLSEQSIDLSKNETIDDNRSSNSFGVFSRLYAKKRDSKFNAFLQLKPSFVKIKNDYLRQGTIREEDDPFPTISAYQSKTINKINGYEIDLGIGVSYKVYQGLSAQLNLPAVINHSSLDYRTSGAKQHFTSIFQSNLSNAYVSFNYQF